MADPNTTRAVGFSGTRSGMTAIQATNVAIILRLYAALRHGDCKGSDEQAHDIARELGLWIESHPPIKSVLRAFCTADVIHPPKDYLPRNHDIVAATSRMIATPAKMFEDNSGTWATIRHSWRVGKPVTIVFPDGTVQHG